MRVARSEAIISSASTSRTRLVVDASAFVELLLQSDAAAMVEDAMRDTDAAAPSFFDAEVLSALRRFERLGDLDSERAEHAVRDLVEARIDRFDIVELVPDAWELRHNLTAYDAFYVALAYRLQCPILTADWRMVGIPSIGVELRLVGG